MVFKQTKKYIVLAVLAVVLASAFALDIVAATTVTVLDGKVSITDTATSMSESGGTVTVTAKGGLLSQTTNTITITNETDSKASISFDYAASNYSSFSQSSASGTYTGTLDAGGTLTLSIKGKRAISSNTATLKLSNFSLTVAAASSKVTFQYDNTLGSVTAGGEIVASGGLKEATLADGIAIVATPVSGAKFLGWVDGNGLILSTGAEYTLNPVADMTVKAAFAKDGGTPWFGVGVATQTSVKSGLLGMSKIYYYTVSTSYLFDDLNAAAAKAASDANAKCVVLMNSGTLPAGDYTIPSGVTLLIPFDSANTMYTTQVQNTTDTYVKPTEYRTLTMADGAKLELNGSMSVSAKQQCAQGSKANGGSPTGPASFVKLQGSSSITVNNGGVLYAYGFITGSGSVTANSGATVYECFQFMDFRGGTQSTDMDKEVFPFSQYYVQNIEVPLTLYSGAEEHAYTTIYMSSADFGTVVNFIGPSDAMFNLTSGYVVKQYDGTTDRMMIEVNGNLSVSTVELEIGTSSINSEDYDLPINGNITVTAKSGSNITIKQDLAFLPGSEMIIESGATCTLGSGYNVYIYDADEWGAYCGAGNKTFIPLTYAPGRTYKRTAADLVDATFQVDGTVDASAGYLYTTAGGANIYSTGTGVVKLTAGTQTVTYQITQASDTSNSTYPEIPITPAKLKNANTDYEPYVTTAGRGTTAITYGYENGRWYSLAVNPTNANTDQTNISAKFRVEDYLWMNGSCYFGKVDAESVWADIATTNISVQTFNATTKSWEDVTGYVDAVVINGEVYLVKKVPSDEIPKNITFRLVYTIKDGESITAQYLSVPITVNFMTYADAYIEANKNASADAVREDGVKVLDMVDLLEAMKTYGTASEKYFGQGTEDNAPSTLPEEMTNHLNAHKSDPNSTLQSVSGSKGTLNEVSISTKGATFYFDERISMTMQFALKGGDWANLAGNGKVTQIGLLVGEAGELMSTNGGYKHAYLLFADGGMTGASGNKPTLPNYDNFVIDNNTTTDWATITAANQWSISFDLASADYATKLALRIFIVVDNTPDVTEDDNFSVLYGTQYHYGLADYVVRTYEMTPPAEYNANAYKHLMVATWEYMEAAKAAFAG